MEGKQSTPGYNWTKARKLCGNLTKLVRKETFDNLRQEYDAKFDVLSTELMNVRSAFSAFRQLSSENELEAGRQSAEREGLLNIKINQLREEIRLITESTAENDNLLRAEISSLKKSATENDNLLRAEIGLLNRSATENDNLLRAEISLLKKSAIENKHQLREEISYLSKTAAEKENQLRSELNSLLKSSAENEKKLQRDIYTLRESSARLQSDLQHAEKNVSKLQNDLKKINIEKRSELDVIQATLRTNISQLQVQINQSHAVVVQLQSQVTTVNAELNSVKGIASVSYMREYTTLFDRQKRITFSPATAFNSWTIPNQMPDQAHIDAEIIKWLDQAKKFNYKPFDNEFQAECSKPQSHIHTLFSEIEARANQENLLSRYQKNSGMLSTFCKMDKAVRELRRCLNEEMHSGGLPFDLQKILYAYNNIISHPKLNLFNKAKTLKLVKESFSYIDKNVLGTITDRVV